MVDLQGVRRVKKIPMPTIYAVPLGFIDDVSYWGTREGYIYAYDLKQEQTLWKTDIGGGGMGTRFTP
jgi:glucose dehydrogenase